MQHVVIRLKDGTDVIGILLNEREKGIDLSDACILRYGFKDTAGYPSIMLMKYCAVSRSFDVYFKREDISHTFYDPVPTLVNYFEKTIVKIKENYSRAFDKQDNSMMDALIDYDYDYDTVEEMQEQEELILAMAEKFSSNTTIQ